jgi:two-component system NtrC family sensor kinase
MQRIDTEKRDLGQQSSSGPLASRSSAQMAAGFAHEINNLQIMKSDHALIKAIFSSMKKSGELKESKDVRDLETTVDQLNRQIERCAKITQAI